MSIKAFVPFPSLALVLGMVMIPCGSLHAQESDEYYRGIVRGLELFGSVYQEILERYANNLDPQKLAESGIQGMVATLDPYSAYTPATETARTRRTLRVGIGVEVQMVDDMLTVTEVLDGYQAQRAGVRVGDRIVALDAQYVLSGPVESAYALLRGEIGTAVQIKVQRAGVKNELTLELQRERVHVPGLRYAGIVGEGIALFQINRFSENVGNEVRTALLRLLHYENQSDKVQGVLLDLRGNSGGVLEEAVSIAENFVPKGKIIVSTDGRDTIEHDVWYSESDPIAANLPLVILVDRNSASASELLAAAIQDHDLGVIVGEPTVGKGVVQSVITLPFGASFRLTTAWYVTPSGRSIQRVDRLGSARQQAMIHDSLLSEHFTDNGRPVVSGAGIIPDSIVLGPSEESMVARLSRAGAFFSFASQYTGVLDSLPSSFHVNDALLASFEEYALGRLLEVEQQIGILATVDSLSEWFTEARGSARVKKLFDDLGTEIVRNDEREFAGQREEIRQALAAEIKGRFYKQAELIHVGFEHDAQVQVGLSLLKNSAAYQRLLHRK